MAGPRKYVELRRLGTVGPDDLEPDLLTRPMRLSDYETSSRRPRVNGSVAGA